MIKKAGVCFLTFFKSPADNSQKWSSSSELIRYEITQFESAVCETAKMKTANKTCANLLQTLTVEEVGRRTCTFKLPLLWQWWVKSRSHTIRQEWQICHHPVTGSRRAVSVSAPMSGWCMDAVTQPLRGLLKGGNQFLSRRIQVACKHLRCITHFLLLAEVDQRVG